MTHRLKITNGAANATTPKAKMYVVWDTELTGFGVRVNPNGRKTFFYKYNLAGNETRRITIGKHGSLQPARLVGEAFDSLYKQLCSAEKLRSVAGKQVVAPFAFVSVLAGALLLLEIIRRQAKDFSDPSNFWRVSPWQPPVPKLRVAAFVSRVAGGIARVRQAALANGKGHVVIFSHGGTIRAVHAAVMKLGEADFITLDTPPLFAYTCDISDFSI